MHNILCWLNLQAIRWGLTQYNYLQIYKDMLKCVYPHKMNMRFVKPHYSSHKTWRWGCMKMKALSMKDPRCGLDRRSGLDRRKSYSLDYFLDGGTERRSGIERRSKQERRIEWKRVTDWSSVSVNLIETPILLEWVPPDYSLPFQRAM